VLINNAVDKNNAVFLIFVVFFTAFESRVFINFLG
jgi:hypothetical protein